MAAVQYATGKRKSAIARVWLTAGTGDITINERPLNNYFGRIALRNLVQMPFDVSGTAGKYSVTATVAGGGHAGQAGALRHGISKALVLLNGGLREPIKKNGFLTRDSRVKERKKYGQKGARRRFQYSKR
ncbi:MAG: 30S ribosomal protein S9 [Nitrospiraceae bacterium]